jgi:hypothetical protein
MRPLDGPFVPKADLIATQLPGELIIMDPETQQMYSLNGTSEVIWGALPTHTVAEVAALLARQFDVTAEQAERDVRGLVGQLVAAGLLAPREGADHR